MENNDFNNGFGGGFFGSEPQKPFTENLNNANSRQVSPEQTAPQPTGQNNNLFANAEPLSNSFEPANPFEENTQPEVKSNEPAQQNAEVQLPFTQNEALRNNEVNLPFTQNTEPQQAFEIPVQEQAESRVNQQPQQNVTANDYSNPVYQNSYMPNQNMYNGYNQPPQQMNYQPNPPYPQNMQGYANPPYQSNAPYGNVPNSYNAGNQNFYQNNFNSNQQAENGNPYAKPVNNGYANQGNQPYGNQPYPQSAPRQKRKVSAGLIALIVVLSVLLAGSVIGLVAYTVLNNYADNNILDKDGGAFSYTIPDGNGFSFGNQQTTTAPPEHKESDYSSKADADYSGLKLESKPKDAKTNEGYTSEYAFNKVSDSVVGVLCYTSEITEDAKISSQGSGIIISSDGYVLTNAHVIGNSKTMYLLQVVTADGKKFKAGVVGFDSRTDIAVLKLDDAKDLKAAEFGNSDEIELGEDIIVVGNPGGLDYQNSITKGIVSAVDRKLSATSLVKYIQTDAAINPGNSGGPIVNSYGQVIGIATAKIVANYYEGMGFAIPTVTAKGIVDELIKNGYVTGRVRIGITGNNVDASAAKTYGVPQGIIVQEIAEGGPCDGTDLKPEDIITEVDGTKITSFADVYEVLETHKAGDKVTVKYYRVSDKSEKTIEITLQEDK